MLTQCIMLCILAANMLLVVGLLDVDAGVYMITRSALGSFYGHVGFMPLVVRSAVLVPEGLEGTFYSLYMSTVNLGSVLGEELSGVLTTVLGTKETAQLLVFYIVSLVHNIFSFLAFHIAYGR